MTWFPDLAPCTYFDPFGHTLSAYGRLLAVGWLSERHEYTRGTVDPEVRAKLARMLRCPWSPFRFMGLHSCEFCEVSDSDIQDFLESGRPLATGTRNLFIPGRRVVYVAPELVIHYIDQHEYLPPREFFDALMACPPIWSDEYFAELRRSGSSTFKRIVPPQVAPPGRDPRREIARRLAPACVDYIGLDPTSGEAKAFLLEDRPAEYLIEDPYLVVSSPEYGHWVVDIIPPRRREGGNRRVWPARQDDGSSSTPQRTFTHVPSMPVKVFDGEDQTTLAAADEFVRPYVGITREQLAGLLWAVSEYAGRTTLMLEDQPPAGPGVAAADPELVSTHRALVRWYVEQRDWGVCKSPPEPPRAAPTEERVFDDWERAGIGDMKYTRGFEQITRPEVVQLLQALGRYAARALGVPLLYSDDSWMPSSRGSLRRLYAHDALIHFHEHPFTHEEFVRDMRAVLAVPI